MITAGGARGTEPDRAWFDRDVLDVARGLLGASVSTSGGEGRVTVRLTEVEAYRGAADPASHAFRGPNVRNAAMFGEPGRLYVYRHLGIHSCVNVVCGPVGQAAAVLLRAGEVTDGVDLARSRRNRAGVARSDRDLARGPARLAVALGLDLAHDGADLLDPRGDVVVHLPAGPPRGAVENGPRVGVGAPGADGGLFPWRFWLAGERTVSAYRSGAAPRPRRVRGVAGPGSDSRTRRAVRQTRPDTAGDDGRPHDEEDLRE